MKVYLDTCTLNRPLDDKAQMRVALEAEAVLGVLTRVEEGSLSLVASEILALEVQRTSQPERRAFVEAVIEGATEFVLLDDAVRQRGKELEKRGFRAFDALHLASAESSEADYFCTCDDRVLKKAAKQKDLRVKLVSPLQLAEEVSR
ncbi:MAG: PIN domain-containing protein [Planctomycetes bacterium]|nr:PIN domain-containing protein [Planctomycetota bacterium]